MKNLIRKILNESVDNRIVDVLIKMKLNDFEDIGHFLFEIGYEEDEIIEIYRQWIKELYGFDWVDYSKSKKVIMVGSKTNLVSYLMNEYNNITKGSEIYFIDEDGYHFATLFYMGRFLEIRHDGSLDEYGGRK